MAEGLREQSLAVLDLTELPGLDDLHQPSGIIAEAQANCARWFGAGSSFFLVNGASVGIQAAMLSVLAPGDPVLIPRNAHKSIYAGLVLTGARPVYYLPKTHPQFRLPLGQAVGGILESAGREQVKAIVVLNPTYFGTAWNMAELRSHWPGTIIADEAHGAHFTFCSRLPASALTAGADLVVHSTHKNLGALTQGAMLHISKNSTASRDPVLTALDLLQSTSPSYPIMASLESAAWDAHNRGEKHWAMLIDRMDALRRRLRDKGCRVLDEQDAGRFGIDSLDKSKLLLRVGGRAAQIAGELAEKFGVQPELWDRDNILFLTGMGDSERSIETLEHALLEMDLCSPDSEDPPTVPPLPALALTPREAFHSPKTKIKLSEAVGRINGQTLAAYPPGIPIIAAGEVFSREVVEYIDWSVRTGIHWQGSADPVNQIWVVEETG